MSGPQEGGRTDAIERAAEAIARVYYGADALDSLDDLYVVSREMYRAQARAAASVLVPEGSVVIGGTCKDCRWCFDDREDGDPDPLLRCESDGPAQYHVVQPDFGCTLFQRSGER